MALLARKNSAAVNPTNLTVMISHTTGFTSYVDACSIDHARAIAFVINNPELAEIVIDQKACDDWYEQKHSNKYDK